jgi:hypothetical protein
MQTIKIEVKLDGEELTKEDVSNFVAALIEKESLQSYSIALHTDDKFSNPSGEN